MKMRKILFTALILGACVSMQVFAQKVKTDTITFALTVQQQSSVSTSASAANAGLFSQGPLYYKTKTLKMTQADILRAIAIVLHGGAYNFYSSQASLMLVQGELGGFWNINDALAQSYADQSEDFADAFPLIFGLLPWNELTGSFNWNGTDTVFYDEGTGWPNHVVFWGGNWGHHFGPSESWDDLAADDYCWWPDYTNPPGAGTWYEYTEWADPNYAYTDEFATYLDDELNGFSGRTSIADGMDEYARLATGRHFLPVPWLSWPDVYPYPDYYGYDTAIPYATTGEYPPGHMQPWGQIYVRDPGHKDSSGNPLCENVTFFFYLEVEECYDCFYLSSFISDATFKVVSGKQSGPPCCSSPSTIQGKGVDHYYLTLSFDNTVLNPYLNDAKYTNWSDYFDRYIVYYYYPYCGYTGLKFPSVHGSSSGMLEGIAPDQLPYSDVISSGVERAQPYEMRFTLNGIVTYSWTLGMINTGDVAADYLGTATYQANGYGYIGLICSLITGSANFTEKAVLDTGCCDDEPWYVATLNPAADGLTHATGWYGPGYDWYAGYFDPDEQQWNPYPDPNIVGGYPYLTKYGDSDLPDQCESPLNPEAALSWHGPFPTSWWWTWYWDYEY